MASPRAIVVPPQAVQANGDNGIAFVIEDGRAERRSVHLGARSCSGQVVLSGLTAGTQVAVGDLAQLADGTQVRIAD